MPDVNHPVAFAAGSAPPLQVGMHWNDGTDQDEPLAQFHNLDEHTLVIRQSLRTSPEAPFVFLMFGNERALLLDTGHGRDRAVWPLREIVDQLIDNWLSTHPRVDYQLVVAHSHAHSDHIAGDTQFAARPNTTVVGVAVEDVKQFFGLPDWPSGLATLDLGNRKLVVMPSPGHHETAVSVLDPYTGVLFTGDTVYPGRLYVRDMPAFLTTLDKLTALTESGDVSHVLGCHIELDRDGREYRPGAREHPIEASPFMPPDRLAAVRDAALEIADSPGVHHFDGFTIYNGNRIRDQILLVLSSLWARFRKGRPDRRT